MQFHRLKMSKYFAKPYKSFGKNINAKVYHSHYATKTDIKNVSHVDTSLMLLKRMYMIN